MAQNPLTPFAFIETPEQARQRTSLGADLADSTGLVSFLGTLIGRGVQAARGRGPQRQAVEQAEQVQSALQRAMTAAGFDSSEPGSALEASNAFLVNAVRELNDIGRPDLAMQFADKIGAAERDRAAIQESLLNREVTQETLESAREQRQATMFGLQDPETGETLGPYQLSDPVQRAEMIRMAQEAKAAGRTLLPINAQRALELSAQERLAMMQLEAQARREARQGRQLGMTTAYNRFIESSQDAMSALRAITDTATVVGQNLSYTPNTIGEQTRSAINTLGFHAKSLLNWNPDVAEQMEDFAQEGIMRLAGQRDAQFRSNATNLMYAIAAARKDGRMSNQDLELAVETVAAAEKDPKILLSVLKMLARQTLEAAQDRYLGLEGVDAAETVLNGVLSRYDAALAAIGDGAIDLSNPEEALQHARRINQATPPPATNLPTDPTQLEGWDDLSPAEQAELRRLLNQ